VDYCETVALYVVNSALGRGMLLARETEGANRKPMGLDSHERCQVRVYSGDCADCGDCDGCGSGCDWARPGGLNGQGSSGSCKAQKSEPRIRAEGKGQRGCCPFIISIACFILLPLLLSFFMFLYHHQRARDRHMLFNLLVLDLMMLICAIIQVGYYYQIAPYVQRYVHTPRGHKYHE